MNGPNMNELRTIARFQVGDEVWIKASGPWKVVQRYWSRSKGHVAYDLLYANGVTLHKVPDAEIFSERQHIGIGL